ncbi:MAG: helix-turn-helix domain-containing protein [Balneolales bacterium]
MKNIIKKILFGELRPWLDGSVKNLVESVLEPDNFDGVIEKNGGVLTQPYVRVNSGLTTVDDLGIFYLDLLEAFSESYICNTLVRLKKLNDPRRMAAELNAGIGPLVDLAKEAHLKSCEGLDAYSARVITLVRRSLMATIADLSLRYPQLEGVRRYDADKLYRKVFKVPKPGHREIYLTNYYFEGVLNRALRDGKSLEDISDIWLELIKSKGSPEVFVRQDSSPKTHIENVVFLKLWNENVDYEKLADSEYCRHRVQQCVIEDRVHFLTASRFNIMLPGIRKQTGYKSEAAIALEACLKKFETRYKPLSPSEVASAGTDGTIPDKKGRPDFVNHYSTQLMPYDDVVTLLGVDKSTVRRYFDKYKIKIIEFSNQKRYVRRTDFDRLIEELSKLIKIKKRKK